MEDNCLFDEVEDLYDMADDAQRRFVAYMKSGGQINDPVASAMIDNISEMSQDASYRSMGIFF